MAQLSLSSKKICTIKDFLNSYHLGIKLIIKKETETMKSEDQNLQH